jgi:hypothetical protein
LFKSHTLHHLHVIILGFSRREQEEMNSLPVASE